MPAGKDQRGSPEALLAIAEKERRGRLKIFLGAAPGVGKTYGMLAAARAEKAAGRDVVVGVVETHGRPETEALLEGLEIIPHKPTIYMNRIMGEFDIDKALARHPGLLLLDECAHTNIPGSRHPKRWQDTEELLAAGINVWTTLNVQHLESLNDVILKITGVRVRETLPDRVFEQAAEVVLVDLPPEELLQRMAEGKVYVQEMAARAVKSFFKPQNLTALRELALRRAAERIDADLIQTMKAQGIQGPWAAGERILVCVGPDAIALNVVRAAKRMADLMDAPWIAVHVEKPGGLSHEWGRRHVDEALKLAEALGAETKILVGNDVPGELLRFAKAENVTEIVVGRSRGGHFAQLFRRSLPHELVRRAEGIAVHFLAVGEVGKQATPRRKLDFRPKWRTTALLWATAAVAAAVALGRLLETFTAVPNVSMIFLMAVLFPAVNSGIWPAIYASLLSFLAYNFFFIEPRYTFTVAQPHELLALCIFLVVAVIASTLAGRVRNQAVLAVQRMRATRRLYEFTRRLSSLATPEDIAEAAAAEIHAGLARQTLILLEQPGDLVPNLVIKAAWPPEDTLDMAEMSAARWALKHNEPAGAETSTLPTVPWLFVPLRTSRETVGVVGIAHDSKMPPLDSEARALLGTLVEQTAAALERASLARDMVTARAAAETERMRNTLLASISHDFRTPLASILGAATSLLEYRDKLDAADQSNLLGQIKHEVEDLDDMVRNLLAMTRIDAGALELRRDWIDLREVVDKVFSSARRRGAAQRLEIRLPPDLPLLRADATLVEQALGNAVGNAIAHTPRETRVAVDAEVTPKEVKLRIADDGPGIAPAVLPHVFEKFARAGDPQSGSADGVEGTGLGLAIAKGIMDAHGGSITAESPIANSRGSRITLTFPRAEPPS